MAESRELVAVTLDLPPALEERVVDWLLSREDVVTFSSRSVRRYGGAGHELSVAEQVSGWQRRAELQIELEAAATSAWLAALAASVGEADVRYSVTPIVRSGGLRDLKL